MLYLSRSFQKNNALYALSFNKLLQSTTVEIYFIVLSFYISVNIIFKIYFIDLC